MLEIIRMTVPETEELIFKNQAIKSILPKFDHEFRLFSVGVRTGNRSLCVKAITEFLEKLDNDSVRTIERHFNKSVEIDKFHYKKIICMDPSDLGDCGVWKDYFLHLEDDGKVKITLWR